MNTKLATASLMALGLACLPVSGAEAGACKTHHGKGWAFTKDMAKFQSWEITAQVTGNWPIMSDKFKNERYSCKPDGNGWTCLSKIDVCKS